MDLLDRIGKAWEDAARHRRRAASLLAEAGVPYALVGGHATGAWVRSVDGNDRNTSNVDLLIERSDHDRAVAALAPLGTTWVSRGEPRLWNLLPSPESRRNLGTRLLHAEKFVRAGDLLPNPSLEEAVELEGLRVIGLEALVRMKLAAFRNIDMVHIEDLHFAGLVDMGWAGRFPAPLGERLREVLAAPHVVDPRH